MKKLAIWLVFGVFFTALAACSTIKYVPVETIKEVHVRDSVYFRDTLVRVELERARISDFVDPNDTLVLQTDLARSTAFIDTTRNVLRGTIENTKPYVEKNVPVKEKIVYRDSLVYQDRPYPVEVEKPVKYVPWIVKVLAWLGGISLVLAIIYILRKFHIL